MKHKFLNNLSLFVQYSFHWMYPNEELEWTFANDITCLYLEAVYTGVIKRLIITVPPRTLKSFTINTCFPSWLLAKDPSQKIMAASFKEALAIEQNINSKKIIESNWYQNVFPNVVLSKDQNSKIFFKTTKEGYKRSATFGSAPTGSGADKILIDDPLNSTNAKSQIVREKACQTFNVDFVTRLNNPSKGAMVVLAQRFHEEDLIGYLLKNEPNIWTYIKIPAYADQDYIYYYPGTKNIYKIYKKGEYLSKKRLNKDVLEERRKTLGLYDFEANYMCNPLPAEGTMVKEKWFNYYDNIDNIEKKEIYISLDAASKTGIGNDYCVFTIWNKDNDKSYLLDLVREKMDYPTLKKKAKILLEKWNPVGLLIEDASSGISLIQELRKETMFSILPCKTRGLSKEARLESCLGYIEQGNVYLPKYCNWKDDFIKEVTGFPYAAHDDCVDSLTQYILYIKDKQVIWKIF